MDLKKTDPEFMERFERFASGEVVQEPGQTLDDNTRYLAILAALMGTPTTRRYRPRWKRASCRLW